MDAPSGMDGLKITALSTLTRWRQ